MPQEQAISKIVVHSMPKEMIMAYAEVHQQYERMASSVRGDISKTEEKLGTKFEIEFFKKGRTSFVSVSKKKSKFRLGVLRIMEFLFDCKLLTSKIMQKYWNSDWTESEVSYLKKTLGKIYEGHHLKYCSPGRGAWLATEPFFKIST